MMWLHPSQVHVTLETPRMLKPMYHLLSLLERLTNDKTIQSCIRNQNKTFFWSSLTETPHFCAL